MSTLSTIPQSGGALATMPDIGAMQQASAFSDNFGAVAGVGVSFLPYLQLFSSGSDAVKEGKIGVAHYGYIEGKEKTITDLGKALLVVPLSYRTKAMKTKNTPDGKPLAFHNHKSKEFLEIRAIADDKNQKDSGCLYGPEFLLWLPEQQKYVTFFMGSPTARNAAVPIHALLPRPGVLPKAGILTGVLIDNGTHKWHGPSIALSTQSWTPPGEDLATVVTDFLNPRDSAVVEAAAPAVVNTDR